MPCRLGLRPHEGRDSEDQQEMEHRKDDPDPLPPVQPDPHHTPSSTTFEKRAPHSQVIQTRPSSTPASRSPQRRCSSKNAHSATSGGTGGRMLPGIITDPLGVFHVDFSIQ